MWCPGEALHRALQYSMQPAVVPGCCSSSSHYSYSSFLNNLHNEKHATRHKSTLILLSTCHVPPISAAHLQNLTKFRGLRESQGRWEARISEGSRQAKLLFASEEEAAKAYDKAQYKLHGDRAETNFTLSEKEKMEVLSLDWEDLVLKLQLQGLPEASPSGLAFHGVHYKNQSWHAYVKKDKIRYVGIFGSMLEAIKAYDMAEYNLHGTNALLNYELSEDEAIEMERMDWDMLVEKLGLTVQGRRKHQKTGYRGVRQVMSGKWLASYYYRGTVIQLGLFEALDAAVKAYDSFAYKLCGESAKLNGCLSDDEKDRLSNLSLKEVQQALGRQATRVPRIGEMGARGARLAQGKWEVCVESTMRDSIFLGTTASEAEAAEVHDIAAYKLHKDLARTYTDLSVELRENVDSADWLSVAEKFGLQRLPSYHGVKRLVSGMWQSFLFHGGSYLPIGTFAEGKLAAYATDLCTYKLKRDAEGAVYNSILDAQEKQRVDNMTWGQLISYLREKQEQSPVIAEFGDLEAVAAIAEEQLTRDQRWTLYLCQEQLVQQKMMRRSPRVGQQVVVRRPELADQFSPLNRRADGSPLLVEEVMEGHAAPLLWVCECGNLFLKSPFVLTRVKLAVCHQPECTVSKERDPYTTWGSLN